jgi:hypothetical protein
MYKPYSIYIKDNFAVIKIELMSFVALESADESANTAALTQLVAQCKESTLQIIDAGKNVKFIKTYAQLPLQFVLGFARPGDYDIVLLLKNGWGFVNVLKRKIRIVGQQADFDIAAADNVKHPYKTFVKSSLLSTGAAVRTSRNRTLSIAGMHNATLYNSKFDTTTLGLAKPLFNDINFKIGSYDAAQPAPVEIDGHVRNLGGAKSEILYLYQLNDTKLVNNNCSTMLQYGAHYLTLQFDLPMIEHDYGSKLFKYKFKQHVLAAAEEFDIVYDNASELLGELMSTAFAKSDYPIFNQFTWQLVEVYNVIFDTESPTRFGKHTVSPTAAPNTIVEIDADNYDELEPSLDNAKTSWLRI